MDALPSLEEFKLQSKEHDLIAVRAEFTADAETPLSAYAKLSKNKPAFLFESVVGGEQVSRFSFVGCNPKKIISCDQTETTIMDSDKKVRKIPTPPDPLKIVEEEMGDINYLGFGNETRFSGGAVGYVSYEYANRVEPTVPVLGKDELNLPILYFMIADLVLVFAGTALMQTGQAIEIIGMVMGVYLFLSLFTSVFMNLFNRIMKVGER